MREILFRGKTDKGEWVQGCYTETLRYNKLHWIWDGKNHFTVNPSTIGQYTGLTDKNGTKIFEGDILKFTDKFSNYEWIGKVEFGNPNAEYNWGFQLVYISGAKPNTDILLWFDMEETGAYSELIGNIHDNPELLESEVQGE